MKELLKKNLMSLICGLIVLLAIGAIFWPINGKYEELQTELTNRQTTYTNLQKILTKTRQTPIIPGTAEEQHKLEHFPTAPVIKQWQAVTERIQNESKEMFTAAVDMNKSGKTVLARNVLPDTTQTATKMLFRSAFKNQMDLTDEVARKTGITKDLNPGFMPSDFAINAAKTALEQELTAQSQKDPNGQPLDPNFGTMVTKRQAALPDEMRAKVADNCLMYVDLMALDAQPQDMLTPTGQAPDMGSIYTAQVSYWIQKDVLDSLASVNKGAKTVRDAPIKHLFKIKFASTAFAPLLAATAPPEAANQSSDSASEWKLNYSLTPSGRSSNGVYDVYRFAMRIFVDAAYVDSVLHELTRGKLINVLACDVVSRDTAEYQAKGYFYGDKPIVQLDLQCEALLLREWTTPLMPQSVRTALGIKAAPPAG